MEKHRVQSDKYCITIQWQQMCTYLCASEQTSTHEMKKQAHKN